MCCHINSPLYILVITFLIYALFHASRKPISVVKSVLHKPAVAKQTSYSWEPFGIFQSTGWPAVVEIVAHWWGSKRRGFVMGTWNTHTSVGNIIGSLIAGYYVDTDWGASFRVPGCLLIAGAFLVFLTLVPKPTRTNNVIPYAVLIFFAKLVAYTFLYWLPIYLTRIGTQSTFPVDANKAAQLSVLFDLGGAFGGILAGLMSDSDSSSGAKDGSQQKHREVVVQRSATCAVMLATVIPLLLIYRSVAGSMSWFSLGASVNGPYALVTTAVAADLATQPCLKSGTQALATVTAVIDSLGSLGAGAGPFLTSLLVPFGWSAVFGMLVTADSIALIVATLIWHTNSTQRISV